MNPQLQESDCARCGRKPPESCDEKFCPLNLPPAVRADIRAAVEAIAAEREALDA